MALPSASQSNRDIVVAGCCCAAVLAMSEATHHAQILHEDDDPDVGAVSSGQQRHGSGTAGAKSQIALVPRGTCQRAGTHPTTAAMTMVDMTLWANFCHSTLAGCRRIGPLDASRLQ